MNAIDLTKQAVSLVAGVGAGIITKSIIRNNTNPEGAIDTVAVYTGSVAIGWMVNDAVSDYTDAKIDTIVAWWKKNITETA